MRKYKSGNLKRKERKEKNDREKRGQQNLSNFGFNCVTGDLKHHSEDSRSDNEEKNVMNQEMTVVSPHESEKTIEEPCSRNNSVTDCSIQDSSLDLNEISSVINQFKGDIGSLECDSPSSQQIKDAVEQGPSEHPLTFPVDSVNTAFPTSLLQITLKNNERVTRNWLVWSSCKQALFCFPCRLFSTQAESVRSQLSLKSGYSSAKKWKKLYDMVPQHEQSINHKECYMKWRVLQKQLKGSNTIFDSIERQITSEVEIWKQILKRLLHVTLFLGERGLAFRGNSRKIGDPKNGNFLGILELLSEYDPIIKEHLNKVKDSQVLNKRLQVHYLSDEIQNEFIHCIAEKVRKFILKEREIAKYYSILIDSTPDSAHTEQTTFILRYVLQNMDKKYEIQERFLDFKDCSKKTGEAIAHLILSTLEEKFHVPISDCRGQGYDNGSNMSGTYRGVQAYLLSWNATAKFSPCACHSLNLCGVQAAESCSEAMLFFGIVQQFYNLFSRSPQRWEILKKNIGCSLHALSDTRWSARVDSIRPFAGHLSQLSNALEEVKELNLTSETRAVLLGLQKYLSSFECLLMASLWVKVLVPIDNINKILQARNATIDIEVENLRQLMKEIDKIRCNWDGVLSETKIVASAMEIAVEFKEESNRKRKRKRFPDENASDEDYVAFSAEENFKINVFYKILDTVKSNISFRYEAVKSLDDTFGFLWKYMDMDNHDLAIKCKAFIKEYKEDVTAELIEEIQHLKAIHPVNISEENCKPLCLLNKLSELNCISLFPNCVIALRIFLTLPVTVAEAERSFSVMGRIKNCLRSTMGQGRLSDLGVLAIESDLARKVNFDEVIQKFADSKARKAFLSKT